jgi:4-amino-4-deoxy-L-arabinose transferase-like glycosyltransferase
MAAFLRKLQSWDAIFWLLLGVLAIAFAYLATKIHVFIAGDPITQFAPEVVGLLSGGGYHAFGDPWRGPLFPALVGIVAWLLRGDIFTAGLVVEAGAYIVLVVATYFVIRSAFGQATAFFTAAAVGVCTPVITVGLSWLTDLPFAAISVSCLWAIYAGTKRWTWMGLLAGLIAGLAFDMRWNGIFLIGVAVLAATLNPWRLRPRQAVLWLLLFLLAFVVVAIPWLYINYLNHGSPFFNRLNESGIEGSLVSPKLGKNPSVTDLALKDPLFFFPRYFQRYVWNGLVQLIQIVPPLIAIFVPAGAILFWRRFDRRKGLLLIFSGVFWSIAIITHFEPRYNLALLPILIVLSLSFLLSEDVPDFKWRGWLSVKMGLLSIALAWIGIIGYQQAEATTRSIDAGFEPQREVAELLANLPPGYVAGTKVAVEYYSGARFFIPQISGAQTDLLRSGDYLKPPSGYSHVFAEQGVPLPQEPPSLLDPLTAPAQLEAIYFKSVKPRAVLYQVLPLNQVQVVETATVSALNDASHGPAAVLDTDSQTGWLTPLAVTPTITAELTVTLQAVAQIDRIWILPPADPLMFPKSYRLELSTDGAAWTQVAQVTDEPLNLRQDPHIYTFVAIPARYVRFTALEMRTSATGQYQAGLNGLRASLSGLTLVSAP